MKAKLVLTVAITSLVPLARAAETIEVNKLPAPVRQALGKAGESIAVKEVTARKLDGKLVYDVEIEQQNAPNPKLRIAADGTVLRDSRVVGDIIDPPAPDDKGLKLHDLPPAVKATVEKEAAGRPIGDIDREFWNGEPGYKITLREPGRNPAIFVNADGSLRQPTEKPPGAATLFRGTRFEDTPTAVQQTIRREAPDGEIVKIEKQGMGPDAFYRVELKNRKETFELQVYESGSLLRDSRRSPVETKLK